jgi:hypothetical protein
MAQTKDSKDILHNYEEYSFQEAIEIFAGESADKIKINAAKKMLREAAEDKKLNAKLAYHPNIFVESFKNIVREAYSEIPCPDWCTDIDQWRKVKTKENNELKKWLTEQDEASDRSKSSDFDWKALAIKYLKHKNNYNEEVFNRESEKIDWDKSTVTYADIREYCERNKISHEYFYPVSEKPGVESAGTPEPAAASSNDSQCQTTEELKSATVNDLKDQSEKKAGKTKWTPPDNWSVGLDDIDLRKFDKYLDCLTEQQYYVFVLKEACELSDSEVGRRLNISRQQVKPVHSAAMKKIYNNRENNRNKQK